jgi:hypothetical protein
MKKSIMDIRKQEEREAFLKLAPIDRLRTMHDRFMQFVALRARSENKTEYEIYRQYLKDNPRHYERTPRKA